MRCCKQPYFLHMCSWWSSYIWGEGAWVLTKESSSLLGKMHILGGNSEIRLSNFIGNALFPLSTDSRENLYWLNSSKKLLNLLFLSSFSLVSIIYILISKVKYLYDETPLQLGDCAFLLCLHKYVNCNIYWPSLLDLNLESTE